MWMRLRHTKRCVKKRHPGFSRNCIVPPLRFPGTACVPLDQGALMTTQQVDSGLVPYQILNAEGKLVGEPPDLSSERMLALYRYMQLGRAFSNKIIALQRQGRATFHAGLFVSGYDSCRLARRVALPALPDSDWYADAACCGSGDGRENHRRSGGVCGRMRRWRDL